ncbi:hypothetical protein LTR09_004613 [Extremus antarcticus]|uniref:Uncharacterized protein n=1 Tax=Extremus antarcticus TaxID=702011 RepID=A0AAJ0GDU8_9PEZI|nr:hypothetical protein LTR09_004613 [Extremus antarcticus]
MSEDQRINVCKTGLDQIYNMLQTAPQNYRNYLALGRSVIAHINSTTFMQQTPRTAEQAWMVAGLQRLAALDDGNRGTIDITAWCSQQWTILHQRDASNVAALRGLGQAWLTRAQPVLAKIHRVDGSSSSSGDSSQRSVKSITSSEDERQNTAATAEAERRSGTQDYVEARGFLQPATEYLERAVAAATEQSMLSGGLLAKTAEAYMSLGNASSPRTNEQYFRRALQLLRAASELEGYTLSRYLQQYLDDYGRLALD